MIPENRIVEDALLKAESRGGTLLHLPTDRDPIWSCYRLHQWSATYKQIVEGLWCEECSESLGESAIRLHLEDKKVEYQQEATFPSLSIKGQLRFDFFVPRCKLVIEADGEQHFGKSKFKVRLLETLERDEFKDKWCEENGFSMLRIPYWRIAETEELIDRGLNMAQKERIYIFDHREWRQKAIKALRGRKKTPKSPAPKGARQVTKDGRDERRKQVEEERQSIRTELNLPMPEFSPH
jgi:very-short-patch-repair endonuclease